MLGWAVRLTRPVARLTGPSDARLAVETPDSSGQNLRTIEAKVGETVILARWECNAPGLDWLSPAEESGNCVTILGGGLLWLMVVRAGAIRDAVVPARKWGGPPEVRPSFQRRQAIGPRIRQCSDDEWLIVEAWDLS